VSEDPQGDFVERYAPKGEQYVTRGPKGDQGERGAAGPRGLSSKTARAIVALFLAAFIAGGGGLFLASSARNAATQAKVAAARAVQANNKKWCTAMVLLTSHPVPRPPDPSANPSREQNYQDYVTFRTLRRRLGCG